MILNKEEATLLINDLADQIKARYELAIFTPPERDLVLIGVQQLRSDFIKRIDDYV